MIVAIIGPPKNPLQAGDITSFIRYRLRETDGKRLYIPDDENLELEVDDPSPGNPKVSFRWRSAHAACTCAGPCSRCVRYVYVYVCMCVWVCVAACVPCLSNQVLLLRYSIFNRRGYVKINLIERPGRAGFYLERTLDITASPTVPALVITGANFGHPAASTRSYDATEVRVVCTKANLRELLSELSSLCYVLCALCVFAIVASRSSKLVWIKLVANGLTCYLQRMCMTCLGIRESLCALYPAVGR